ncbi:MAG TPA: thioesterase family protein [Polyangiaceae bacterium]|nr:thioesterase family protein [Polyangiaceae bacterium]
MKTRLPEHCVSRYATRVRFVETDLMGILHHATHLTYFEAARVEYLRRRGLAWSAWAHRGVHLPVVEANLRYRKTASFDEELFVESRLTELTRVRVRFDYRILRMRQEQEEVIAEGETLLCCVDDQHVVRRIPAEVAEGLLAPELANDPTAVQSRTESER